MPWRASVLTIFPEMFPGPLGLSLAGRALEHGLWSLEPVDIRAFATDRHRSVDDTPAGGGPGMVMKPDVLASGDHAKVVAFRRSEAERLTRERRPDLWAAYLDAIRRSTTKR